jgi:Ca2+-binding EF-hand superfamily protein
MINIIDLMKRTFLALVVATSALLFPARAEEGADKRKADPAKAFAKIDANSDGSVTKAEFMASPRGQKDPEKAAKKFTKMDADANGSVTLDEFKASASKQGKNDDQPAKDGAGSDE